MQLGRLAEAEPLARGLARDVRDRFGDDHAFRVMALGNVGVCLLHQGRGDEALAVFEEVLPIAISAYGEENRKTAWVRDAIESTRAGMERE
jgi:hypothetical protein